MSIARDILDRVNRHVNLPLHGDGAATLSRSTLYVLDDVLTPISGVVDQAPQLLPEFLIDFDPREMMSLESPDKLCGTFSGVKRPLNQNDLIMFGKTKLKLLRFDLNEADIVNKYWLQRLIPGYDV